MWGNEWRSRERKQATETQTVACRTQLHFSLWLLPIFLATFLAYIPAMNGAILWDDDANVTRPELQSAEGLYRIWFEPGATQQYYPLLHTAFWLEHKLWGDATLGYHLVNITWHLISVTLVYAILVSLEIPGALLAAGIFALHPVMVESVAWITEQKNTLSGMFYFGAMLAYLRFDENRRTVDYLGAFALFVLALFGKTATVTLPGALLVIVWWKHGSLSWSRDIRPLIPFAAIGITAGSITSWVERTKLGTETSEFALSLSQRVLVAGRVIWFYLGKLFYPVNLVFMYPKWTIDPAQWRQWLFPLAALLLTGWFWMLRHRFRGPLAGWLYFCGTLLPVLGFMNVFYFFYAYVSDHFQYLASLGIITISSAGFVTAAKRFRWQSMAGGVAILAVLAALTYHQSGLYYTDKFTLYETILTNNPECWLAELNLGSLLVDSGRDAEGIDHYKRALALNPTSCDAHSNLGIMLCSKGRLAEGLEHLKIAAELNPKSASTHHDYANGLLLAKRYDEAVTECQEAVKLMPNSASERFSFGLALARAGRIEQAKAQLRIALEIRPDYPQARELLSRL